MFPDMDDSVTDLGESFKKGQIVFDLIYNPVKTKFLKLAKKNGAEILDGLNMLIFQAAKSFELWTGEEMPQEQVKNSIKYYIEN